MSFLDQHSRTSGDETAAPPPSAARSRAGWGYLASAVSGLLLAGAFPKPDIGWLAWFALAPYLATFPHARMRTAIGQTIVFAAAFIGIGLSWIWQFAAHAVGFWMGSIAWFGAIVTQGTAYVLFACGAQWLSRARNPWTWRLGAPCLWTLLEWARQFGTFGSGWGDLAYTQYRTIAILQVTKLAGVWGLSFLILFVNLAIAEGFRARWGASAVGDGPPQDTFRNPIAGWHAAGALVVAAVLWGSFVCRAEPSRGPVTVAALQGNFPEDEKATPAYVSAVLSTYSEQEHEAARHGAVLAVWPETALPGYLRLQPGLYVPIVMDAETLDEALLVGNTERNFADNRDENALTLVRPDGAISSEYLKLHLMPFGEYIPLQSRFPWLRKMHLYIYDMDPGTISQPLIDAGPPLGKIGTAICFDSTFGELTRSQTARGTRLLVVTTNDSWYGMSAAARQHAAFSSVRACECDRFLVRCAATGISEIIDPAGRVRAQTPMFRRAVLIGQVAPRTTRTPYVRWGDWFVAACAGALLAIMCLQLRCRLAARRRPCSGY